MSNSKKSYTSLTLSEGELLAAAVREYPCLYDKNHRSHKEKSVVQNVWEAVADKLDFIDDDKNFFCYFRCLY